MTEDCFKGTVVQIKPLIVLSDITAKRKRETKHTVSAAAPRGWQVGDQVKIVVDVTQDNRPIIAVKHPTKGDWRRTAGTAKRKPAHQPRAQRCGGGHGAQQGHPNTGQKEQERMTKNAPSPGSMFLNPYALIPAPPRDGAPEWLGDGPGPGHDLLRADHWSGTIPVTITTQSPLLLLDQGAVHTPGDRVPVRVDRQGKPILEWTALKGMLRSYFEAVTNSRFSVVDDRYSQFPVKIKKKAFPAKPAELLYGDHRPAASRKELSPADRLFGWARVEAGTGDRERGVDEYAGHVSCHGICCTRTQPIESGKDPLWLAPLNSPKPEQFRFRLLDGHDNPIADGTGKSTKNGYRLGMRLGRAFYWPHKGLPDGYWKWPGKPKVSPADEIGYVPENLGDEENPCYREYLAPRGTKKKVTKAINGWVRPNTEFDVILRVDNIEPRFLGALLWLLSWDDFTFMLGGGKPLGFGAVTVRTDLKSAKLATGESWRRAFGTWGGCPSYAEEQDLKELIDEAGNELPSSCKNAMVAMGRGVPTLRVHTPRRSQEPQAESYEWFVANEKGERRANPAPDSPNPGLPYEP